MPFLTPLRLESARGRDYYVVSTPLVYDFGDLKITVPTGTRTDFASIPSNLHWLIDSDDGCIRDAAVVHDYLYSQDSDETYPHITRVTADLILKKGMKELGAPLWAVTLVYHAVRVFGKFYYKAE